MPNHIQNKLTITGNDDQVKEVIERFSTLHERVLRRTHDDSQIVCKEIGGSFIGWYNEEKEEFNYSSDRDKVIKGLPDGIEYEYQEEFIQMPDFDKVIPTPEILKDTEFHTEIISRAKNAMGVAVAEDFLGALEKSNRINDCFSEIKEKDTEDVIKAIKAYKETGFFYWYDWNIKNWGTKWNSYSCDKQNESVFTFQTAWSGVTSIIEKMSSEFPSIEFQYSYADEDTGSNTGIGKIQNGLPEMTHPENGSVEAYDLAFSLRPDDKEYYQLIDGKYEYVEEE